MVRVIDAYTENNVAVQTIQTVKDTVQHDYHPA